MGQSNFHRKPGRTQNKGRTTVKPPPVAIDTSDDETSDQCPEPTGFFADAEQCDKYYACNDGAISERLCPDGMVFNDYSIDQEKCDLPYNIDCSKRQKLRKYILKYVAILLFRPFNIPNLVLYTVSIFYRNSN